MGNALLWMEDTFRPGKMLSLSKDCFKIGWGLLSILGPGKAVCLLKQWQFRGDMEKQLGYHVSAVTRPAVRSEGRGTFVVMPADAPGIPVQQVFIAKKGKLEGGVQRHCRKQNKGRGFCGHIYQNEWIEAMFHIFNKHIGCLFCARCCSRRWI